MVNDKIEFAAGALSGVLIVSAMVSIIPTMASGISMVAVTILLLVSCIIVACCNE
jgi:hypothetical protein